MHYYKFNIADYRKDTLHLSPAEHFIYRELIDWYYLDETPIPKKTQSVLRRLRLGSDDSQNLANVLNEFFVESENGYKHARIDKEIEAYRVKADIAKANGSKGGRPKKPRKTQQVNSGNQNETGSKANHKPLTINQDKKIKTLVHENWQPSEKTVEWFAKQQFPFLLKEVIDDYIDSCHAKGYKYLNHDAALKNWAKKRQQWASESKSAEPEPEYGRGGI